MMKKTMLATAALLVLALPALAYVQPGSLNQNAKVGASTAHRDASSAVEVDDGGSSGGVSAGERLYTPAAEPLPVTPPTPVDGEPMNPVPEPGTMALASMGLLAVGAALRHRRRS